MTAYEILDYVEMEHAAHGSDRTKVTFHDGSFLSGRLLAADQIIDDSLKSNIWNYRLMDDEIEKLNGDDIKSLNVD